MLLDWGRDFILLKDADAKPARIIGDIEYYPISDYLDIKHEFERSLMSLSGQLENLNLIMVNPITKTIKL